jgi:AcrR family transcriptional regulator
LASAKSADPRERLVGAAYELFSRHGIQAVGIDRILDEAGVAKSTLYKHFRSKDDLIVATLQRRDEVWTHGWLERDVEQRAGPPGARLLAIFDAFDHWFRRTDFESCMFLATLLESHDRRSRVGAEALKRLADIRSFVADLAEQAGVSDPEAFAREWQILMSGSILLATQGDREAAKRAQEVGRMILEREGIDSGEAP